MHHVDDAARGVQGGAGAQGDGQVTGMCPEPVARHRVLLRLLGKLGFGNALGGPHDDPPLAPQRERERERKGGFEERKAKKSRITS